MSRVPAQIVLLTHLFLLAACSSAYRAPVAEIGDPRFLDSDRIHRVNAGETLYAVAWIYDLDFMHIARVNGLASPYTIVPGQILNVDPRAQPLNQTTVAGSQPPPAASNQPPPASRQPPAETAATTPANAQSPVQVNPVRVQQGPVSWGWPAQGALVGRFSEAGVENKGIDIAGRKGDNVVAAADGQVVYAGSGLLRYGELLIIKHNDLYLSAYAHNDALLVSEGDRVSKGEKIAELGSTGVDTDMLHFEIRLEGKPVDPLGYLPPRS